MTDTRSNSQIIATAITENTPKDDYPIYENGREFTTEMLADVVVAAMAAAGRLVTPEHDAQVLRTYADELAKSTSAEVWDKADFVSDVRDWADGVSDGTVS